MHCELGIDFEVYYATLMSIKCMPKKFLSPSIGRLYSCLIQCTLESVGALRMAGATITFARVKFY